MPWSVTVVCDFDGTITTVDTAELVLRRFADGDWLEPDRLLARGRLSLEECMQRQFAMVHRSPREILARIEGDIGLRPNLPKLVSFCAGRGIRFVIASAGLDFVIEHFLHRQGLKGLEVISPRSSYDGSLRLEFPPLKHAAVRDFKEDLVRTEQEAGRIVVYLGDGLSDMDAATAADVKFAVLNRRLHRALLRSGCRVRTFRDFAAIVSALDEAIA
jgi:2,3-diketo-5-methylthio-1-phosphopentane phosphatase